MVGGECVLRVRLPSFNLKLWFHKAQEEDLVHNLQEEAIHLQEEAKDLLMASIYFHPDYLYFKLPAVPQVMEMMETMEVTQE